MIIREAWRCCSNVVWFTAVTLLLEGYSRLAMWRRR
jgi:hypothetical protein